MRPDLYTLHKPFQDSYSRRVGDHVHPPALQCQLNREKVHFQGHQGR